jgi:uncharacterized protein involved in outer membrane biogenesis
MKRILKIAFIAGLAMLFFPGLTGAQEKKEQKKIKIVVSDNGAAKVLIDTTFTGNITPDSIKLKDGQVIYISKSSGVLADKGIDGDKEENISVTYNSNGNGDKKITREIKIVAGDSVNDEPDGDLEKQSYVIAKDGMVITIEGGNEDKVKELAGFIEAKLGVTKGDKAVKQCVTKEETREEIKN